jgi:hypothetical protein
MRQRVLQKRFDAAAAGDTACNVQLYHSACTLLQQHLHNSAVPLSFNIRLAAAAVDVYWRIDTTLDV